MSNPQSLAFLYGPSWQFGSFAFFGSLQVAHPELGQAVLERVATALADVGKIESAGRLEGKSMTMILAPK